MLTDAFVYRYQNTCLRDEFTPQDQALLMQGFRLCFEQVFPFWVDGKENSISNSALRSVHDQLTMELGLSELSPKYYSYQTTWNGSPHMMTGTRTLDSICKNWLCKPYDPSVPVSRFLAERISFFELTFRMKENQVIADNAALPERIKDADIRSSRRLPNSAMTLPGRLSDGIWATNATLNALFRQNVEELNARFRQAGYRLNYHNGFIQIAGDVLSTQQIEMPFWEIASGSLWKNVDLDMKEAIDRRDNGGRDPTFYAAKALESAIKIISDTKGFTRGSEKGAAEYIDNLVSAKNGRFIDVWESDALKGLFSKVRNPLGHGPGGEPMPELSPEQTNWVIETCMSWTKSLARRL
jgi:AbiJ N-terminal domain 4